ncbi:MAG TPA: Smr/MutS family protein [Gaiellaceae bacterium]|nr:Smr/MutS family protein [Gaiellaceae bacterium]
MDGDALAALELPAILDRLAAAAATELGAGLARALAPSVDAGEVAARKALTLEAVSLLDAAEDPPLAGISDVTPAVERSEREGVLGPSELRAIAIAARVAVDARRVVVARADLAPCLAEIAQRIEPSLHALAGEIDRCVEEDGSDLRDTASPKLRKLRAEVRSGGSRVRDELARIARSSGVRDALQESFLAERGGRPVLAVRAASRAQVPGIVHDASSTGQTVFVEPLAVVELNNRLAEAAAEAREEAERILRELSAAVAGQAGELCALVAAAAELDLALACGSLSRGWHGVEVEVADEVRLIGVRHPLLERATAVPIDLDLDGLRALVISGPNTGGKTVALKTLGLAALLHQCGLLPPATEATLPVFDDVLADIGDRQSIEMSLSTFSGHVQTLISILEGATHRSLVLLDEVAAGTDPQEGAPLAQALLERLASQARLTVVTTHYAELKEWASVREDVANAATGFEVETDTPLYRLALGRPGTSHALRVAERLGLDPAVVADARSRVEPERLRASELVAEAEASERVARERREDAERTARLAERREQELAAELERVRASAERVRRDAHAAAQRELAEARAEIAALRAEVRKARRSRREADQDRALGAATERAARAEQVLSRHEVGPLEAAAPLAPGDPVESDVGVRGTIAAVRGDEAEVVGAAGQRVRIPLARLRPARERAPEERAPVVQVRAAARGEVSDRLDVRGQTGDEAREQVRRLVDDASLAGLREVRIVHGRGTGALRTAVREELQRHPLVDRAEPAADDGATIAHLS